MCQPTRDSRGSPVPAAPASDSPTRHERHTASHSPTSLRRRRRSGRPTSHRSRRHRGARVKHYGWQPWFPRPTVVARARIARTSASQRRWTWKSHDRVVDRREWTAADLPRHPVTELTRVPGSGARRRRFADADTSHTVARSCSTAWPCRSRAVEMRSRRIEGVADAVPLRHERPQRRLRRIATCVPVDQADASYQLLVARCPDVLGERRPRDRRPGTATWAACPRGPATSARSCQERPAPCAWCRAASHSAVSNCAAMADN